MAEDSFRFLDLPGEIRNKIYRLLLCNFKELHDFSKDSFVTVPQEITTAKHDVDTAILRTNHQVYGESKDILLKENQFVRVELHVSFLLPVAVRTSFIVKRVPVITSKQGAIDKFKGQVMTYRLEEETRMAKSCFTGLILHRDFDLLCRGIALSDIWMPEFGSKTKHTLVLHDPYRSSSTDYQQNLLAPFGLLRGLQKVAVQGTVDPSVSKALVEKVKQSNAADPDAILGELRELKAQGTEYFKKGDSKMSSECWAKACIQIQRLRAGPSWGALSSDKSFTDAVRDLVFVLNLNRAQNTIKVMEQSLDDMARVDGLGDNALSALQLAHEETSAGGGWQPGPLQMGKLWFRKAKVHRLCKDYRDAWQAISFAETCLPGDATVLGEKKKISSLMG